MPFCSAVRRSTIAEQSELSPYQRHTREWHLSLEKLKHYLSDNTILCRSVIHIALSRHICRRWPLCCGVNGNFLNLSQKWKLLATNWRGSDSGRYGTIQGVFNILQNGGRIGLRVHYCLSVSASVHVFWRLYSYTGTPQTCLILQLASFQPSLPQLVHCDASSCISAALCRKHKSAVLRPIIIPLVNRRPVGTAAVDVGVALSAITCVLWGNNKISTIISQKKVTARIVFILQAPSLISYSTFAGELCISECLNNSVTFVWPKIYIEFTFNITLLFLAALSWRYIFSAT